MQQQEDIQIVEQLKNGDLSAYDNLFVKYYKLLCISAYFFLKDEQEAKDLVQTFFLDIWEKKLYLHFHDEIKGYLFRAVKNRCINEISKQKTRNKNHKAFTDLQDAKSSPHDEGPDYYGQMQGALEGMTGQKKVAIQMVYLKGKRYQEAADEMGISINSFKTHLKSGLKILRLGEKNNKNN
ncbi:RNA polymerase sigma factor [Terrimonas alba]|uniref:RNA polymerase sigma factor n=1 Tax=Terrimonas alba TaxID=3349636 RepID=UPI0035F2A03D